MRGKNLLIAVLCFTGVLQTNAYEANLTSSSTDVNKNETFTVTVEIKEDTTDTSVIEQLLIEGIENFNVVSRSQYQGSNSSIREIAGEVKTVTQYVNSVTLTLSPKEIGEFTIGPVQLIGENIDDKTASIKINVNDEKQNNSINEIQQIIDNNSPPQVNEELPDKYIVYILIFCGLIILLVVAILYYKKNEDLSAELIAKSKEEEEREGIKNEDFEEIEIVFPNPDDEDFITKIEDIMKRKISKSIKIKNKTYEEILEIFKEKGEDTRALEEIIDKINELKYSNILVSKAELLDMVKRF